MWFDLFLLAMVLGGIVLGLFKGLGWQLAGIGSRVLGFAVGRPMSAGVAMLFDKPSVFASFVIFAVCYGIISLTCYMLALVWRRKLEEIRLERYDRHMGGFLGAFHGLALWAMISMFLVTLSEDIRKDVLPRPTGKLLSHTLEGIHGITPPGLHDILHPFMHADEGAEKKDPEEPAAENPPAHDHKDH